MLLCLKFSDLGWITVRHPHLFLITLAGFRTITNVLEPSLEVSSLLPGGVIIKWIFFLEEGDEILIVECNNLGNYFV